MIKLVASNIAGWFIGVLGGESPILGTLLSQKLKIGRISQHMEDDECFSW